MKRIIPIILGIALVCSSIGSFIVAIRYIEINTHITVLLGALSGICICILVVLITTIVATRRDNISNK